MPTDLKVDTILAAMEESGAVIAKIFMQGRKDYGDVLVVVVCGDECAEVRAAVEAVEISWDSCAQPAIQDAAKGESNAD